MLEFWFLERKRDLGLEAMCHSKTNNVNQIHTNLGLIWSIKFTAKYKTNGKCILSKLLYILVDFDRRNV